MKLPEPAGRSGALPLSLLLLVVVVACTAWMYWPVLSAGYVWDDFALFVNNARLKSGDFGWATIGQQILPSSAYLRPAVLASFVAEFRFLGISAEHSHLVSFLAFHLNVLLVFALAYGIFLRSELEAAAFRALGAATLYAVHPALIESTAWISGRFDLFLTTAVLLGLNAEVHLRNTVLRVVAISSAFVLALGSKETALMFPLCLLLFRLAREKGESDSSITVLSSTLRIIQAERVTAALLMVIAVAWVTLKLSMFGTIAAVESPDHAASIGGRIWLIFNTLSYYSQLVLFPFAIISPLSPLEERSGLSLEILVYGLVAIAILLAAVQGARRRVCAALLVLAGFATLLPVLNVLPLSITGNIGHARFLALPLVFFSIGVAGLSLSVLPFRPAMRKLVLGLMATAWCALAIGSVRSIVPLWHESSTLWSWAYNKHPESRLAAAQMASVHLRQGHLEGAGQVLEQLQARHGFSFHEQLFYAEYLTRAGNHGEAKNYLLGITESLPKYHEQIDGRAARAQMSQTSAGPVLHTAYARLSLLDLHAGQHVSGIGRLNAAIWYQPQEAWLHVLLAAVHRRLGNLDEAQRAQANVRILVGDGPDSESRQILSNALSQQFPQVLAWLQESRGPAESETATDKSSTMLPSAPQTRQ